MGASAEAWTAFESAARSAKGRRIAGLFAAEPDRLGRLTLDAAGLYLDLSKQPWSLADLDAALALARDAGVEADVLDPIEGLADTTADEDYLSLMRANLEALRAANGC